MMKKPGYLILLISAFLLFSCSKDNEEDDWAGHVDTTSEFVIFIPDIQVYTSAEENLRYLNAIMRKLLDLTDDGFKIKAVVQAGDITNQNTPEEWQAAKRAFSKLDNKIPYIMCTGNHDYGDAYRYNTRFTHYSEYFNYETSPSFIASFEENRYDNSVFRICLHDQPFLVFSLEFAPTDDIIEWADSIAEAEDDQTGIILTHAYLYKDKERFDFSKYGYSQTSSPYEYQLASLEKVNDGEEIWQKLIFPNKNLRFVLCGHMDDPDYIGNLVSENSYGNKCLQLLFDTQSFPHGGNGWIQVLEFKSDMQRVNILTYSVVSGFWPTGHLYQFTFRYE